MAMLVAEGNLRADRETFEEAYRAAEQTGDAEAMGVAVLGLAGLWANEQRGAAGTAQIQARMRHVLRLLDPGSAVALRLRVRLAGESDYVTGQHAAVLAVLDEARRSGDAVAQAEALSVTLYCLLGPDHGVRRKQLATELIGVSAHTGRRRDLLIGLLWNTVDRFLSGDPHAERGLTELRHLLRLADHLAVGFVVAAIDVMLAIRADRLADAEALAAACAQRGDAAGDVNYVPWYGGQMVAIRWYQGRLPELLPMLDQLVHSPTLSPGDNSIFAAVAVAAALTDDRRKAASALARLRGRGLGQLPRSSSWLVTMNGVIEAAHLLGDGDLAAEAYSLLVPYAELPMVGSLGVACFGSVHHALGVASLTVGETRRAVGHFEAAIAQNLALGHWPAVQLSHERLAQAARPVASVTPSGPLQCSQRGRQWHFALGDRSALVGPSVGMLHLAVLIANPGTDIPAADLVAGVAALRPGPSESDQPVLDRAAIADYRRRLAELTGAAESQERDWLLAQLGAATGIGGRPRRFTDNTERARLAAGKAIRRAIDQIGQADAVIGDHLRVAVHTGVRCSYRA